MDIKSKIGIDPEEPSTWRGAVMLITSAGIAALPQQSMVWFLPLCLAVLGLLGFITRDRPVERGFQVPPSVPDDKDDNLSRNESLDDIVRRLQR